MKNIKKIKETFKILRKKNEAKKLQPDIYYCLNNGF